jgi:hypothetical protein
MANLAVLILRKAIEFIKFTSAAKKRKRRTMIFRKLTANDVEARVKSCDEYGFLLLLYKNARVDQNILDETFTPFGWQNKYEEIKGNMYCSIGIKSENGEWIWKSNCGTESNTEKEKGEASDSFKRAGFNWGIGRELYTSPKIKIKEHTYKQNRNGKDVWLPEYYELNVVRLDVSDDFPRRITGVTIIGKSMQGGYREDVIFDWTEKQSRAKQPTTAKSSLNKASDLKASPKQIDILKETYTGNNLAKLLEANNITKIEDLPMAKASELISKLNQKVAK